MKYRSNPALLFSLFFLAVTCAHAQVPPPAAPQSANVSAARGEYIVRSAAVCGQCHAADAKDPDGALSGGMEFSDWRIGTARAANLTSDADTGLGNWSESDIVRALRNGEAKNGRLLAPVMPYAWFHEMSDDDAFSVARYLKSLPAVRNDVRQSPNLIFRFSRIFLGAKSGTTATAPPRAASAEYGAYLAQHAALCAECHTPRTGIRSQADRSRLFAGMANPPKGFPANPANITPDAATGIGRWSEADFIRTLRTGVDPAGRSMHPFMPWHQLQRMSDDDLRAIYLYLRTVPAINNAVPWTPAPNSGG